jgi:hypothetical protein
LINQLQTAGKWARLVLFWANVAQMPRLTTLSNSPQIIDL